MRRLFACEGFRGVVFSIHLLAGGLLLSLWTPAILVGPYKVVSIGASVRYPLPVIPLSAAMLLPDWDVPGRVGLASLIHPPLTSVYTSVTGHCMDGHTCHCPACLLLLDASQMDFLSLTLTNRYPLFPHFSGLKSLFWVVWSWSSVGHLTTN